MGASDRYPVTAYSMCNALGHTTEEVIAALAEGRSGLTPPPFELPFETYCGALPGPIPALPKAIERYDTRLLRMAVLAFDGMSRQVTAAVRRWGKERVAIVLGTSTGGIEQTEEAYRGIDQGGLLPERYDFELHHPFHLTAEAFATLSGAQGPLYVISTACSSGGKTLAAARRLLGAGVVDAVLTGAVDGLCQTTLRGFHSLSILSDEPCRPFCQDRKGISIGEGAGLLLLERRGESKTELLGVGESSDGYHMSSPDPEGRGARAAMAAALAQGGLTPAEIDHINSHGTGTKHNDIAESKAMFEMFGDSVPVASTKGVTGHLLGAGGAIEAIFAVVALEHGWIPATVGAAPLDEEIRIDVNLRKKARRCRAVLSNSFGFGGSNVSVLLGATQ